MSNTSNLSSYDSSSDSSVTSSVAGVCIGLAAVGIGGAALLARWLAKESPEDQKAAERFKEELRRERLKRLAVDSPFKFSEGGISQIKSINLHLRDLNSLIHSAEMIGYRTESSSIFKAEQITSKPVLLQNKLGERLAIEKNNKGGLVVHTAGNHELVHSLVRRHTLDSVVKHLSKTGMEIKTANLQNGEVQILAKEKGQILPGGSATVKAQVRKDGTVWVDVDHVQGNRCEKIVTDLAGSVGAEITDSKKKSDYYQLPGEPTKAHVKV